MMMHPAPESSVTASQDRDRSLPVGFDANSDCIDSSAECLDWTAATEGRSMLPCTPRFPSAPWSPGTPPGVSLPRAGKPSGLLCIPAVRIASNEDAAGQQEHVVHLKEVAALLAQHTNELHRVAAEFEMRFSALCRGHAIELDVLAQQEIEGSPKPRASSKGSTGRTSSPSSKETPDLAAGERDLETLVSFASESIKSSISKRENSKTPPSSIWASISGSIYARPKSPLQRKLSKIVGSMAFDAASTILITAHAIIMGFAANHSVRRVGEPFPVFFKVADYTFLPVYILELAMRLAAEGAMFFFSGWNLFDLMLVGADATAQMYHVVKGGSESALRNAAAARTFRVVRLLRAFRMLRMMRFFRELRMMVRCMVASVKTTLWVMLLLFLFIYIFAVYLTEQASPGFYEDTHLEKEDQDNLMAHFCSLPDAWLALFMAISGGVDWGQFAYPLLRLHWTNGLCLATFVFFTMFAMVNIVTGVFVDCALKAATSDEEEIIQDILQNEDSHIQKIKAIFDSANSDGDDCLSLQELETQMHKEEFRILFKSIGIGFHEVHGLFRLLDADGSGVITLEEFLTGCMRLTEGATSVDMFTLIYESKRMQEKWAVFTTRTEEQFEALFDIVQRLELRGSS